MATLDENAKSVLQKFTDSNGKLIATEDMSDELKEAINYINENNIDFNNIDLEEEPLLPDEELDSEEDMNIENDDDRFENNLEELELYDESELAEELDDTDVEDLGKFL